MKCMLTSDFTHHDCSSFVNIDGPSKDCLGTALKAQRKKFRAGGFIAPDGSFSRVSHLHGSAHVNGDCSTSVAIPQVSTEPTSDHEWADSHWRSHVELASTSAISSLRSRSDERALADDHEVWRNMTARLRSQTQQAQ